MQLRHVVVNGKSFTISAQANAYVQRYCEKRSQAEVKPIARKVKSMLNTAAKAPVAIVDGKVAKLYKRCKSGKHDECPGSFESHSVCTCECHAK